MQLYHNSQDPEFRMPMGAVPCGTEVRMRIHTEGAHKVWLRLWWQEAETWQPMDHQGNGRFECVTRMPDQPGLLWYYFVAEDGWGSRWYLGNAEDGLGGEGLMLDREPDSYQITVYDAGYRTPEWLRNGMMLQIMVDRYYCAGTPDIRNLPPASYYHMHWDDDPALNINDDKYGDNVNNDYFGGNLRGVQEKLDYIQSLGVTVLYLNPIFKARSNHKYNTGDYRTIDPSFGTEEDFRALCRAAKARGIRVILDGVFSHTGSDSIYFNRDGNYGQGGAYNDPESPYRDWYSFTIWPEEYESWWGFKTLPNVHEVAPGYQNFIIEDEDSITAHWLRAGASGWRLDVADELPMNFIRRMRSRVREVKKDSALIGEVWEDPSNKVAYGETRCYCLGDTLDSTMNYPLRGAIIDFLTFCDDAERFVRRVNALRENMPDAFFYSLMNLLGSHDTARAINMLADIGDMAPDRKYRNPQELTEEEYAQGRRRMIVAWTLVNALPGMPCLYYGDEAGLTGMADPYNRRTYPWGHEDVGLVNTYRAIMHERMRNPVLRTGAMKLTAIGRDVVLVERRIEGGRDVFGESQNDDYRVLAVNRAGETRRFKFDGMEHEVPGETALYLDPAIRARR